VLQRRTGSYLCGRLGLSDGRSSPQGKFRLPLTGPASVVNPAAVPGDDAVHHQSPRPVPSANTLGREKRVETVDGSLVHAATGYRRSTSRQPARLRLAVELTRELPPTARPYPADTTANRPVPHLGHRLTIT